jgi:hypothetical protein
MQVMDERSSVMDGRLRMLAVIAGVLLMHSPVWAAALPKPTHTNKTRFRIPFKFDSAALQRMNAREIQLHVSRDHGATWELAQSMAPDGGKFEYQSPADGEYWFSVKTLDGRSQLHPPRGSYETGLIVIVDNTTPVVNLELQQTGSGKVQLTWQITDANLDTNSLRIEYLAPGSRDWEAMSLLPGNSGETAWTVGQGGVVSVRGSVSDLAGNVGQGKTQITVNAAGEREKGRSGHRSPVAKTTHEDDLAAAPVAAPLSAALPPEIAVTEDPYQGPVITPQGGIPAYSRSFDRLVSNSSKNRPEITQDRWSNSPTPPDVPPLATGGLVPTPEISPPQRFAPTQPHAFEPQTQSQPQPRRAGGRQRVVASRRFQVGYKLEDVGPSGIGEVELFITEDNGRKWWKYGDDPDRKSPFDVEVPRDGEYGFAIRVRSGAGLSNEPPSPGELPAVLVSVDQTAPTVELLPLQQGQGPNINQVLIRYRITDDHLSDKPVSLYYAANRNGPWEQITGWKEDTNGEFIWLVGTGVPSQLYVRVMARDAAGNTTKAETPTPIIVDLSRPSAQIIDVEAPVGSAPQ